VRELGRIPDAERALARNHLTRQAEEEEARLRAQWWTLGLGRKALVGTRTQNMFPYSQARLSSL